MPVPRCVETATCSGWSASHGYPLCYAWRVDAAEVPRLRPRFTGIRVAWVFAILVAVILHSSYRWLPDAFLLGCVIAWWRVPRWRRLRLPIVALVGWLVLHASPVDISSHVAGGPRIVPVVFGYPTHETIDAADRGELLLGGCVVTGLEPRWVVVW